MKKRYVVVGPDTKIARLGGRPPKAVLALLIVQAGLFLVYAFADGPKWVQQYLAASAAQSLGLFQLWQPLTALWIHLNTSSLLVNLLSLWIFGSALERWWGPRRFVVFWVVTGLLGLVAGVLFGVLSPSTVVFGSGGASMAMLLAVGLIFPNHMVFFFGLIPLKAKWLSLVIGIFVLIGSVTAAAYLMIPVELGGAVAALPFLFSLRELLGRWRVERAKRKFKVIEGGKKKRDKKYLN